MKLEIYAITDNLYKKLRSLLRLTYLTSNKKGTN